MPAGSDQFRDMKVEGVDVFMRVGKDMQMSVGEAVELGLNPRRLHLFDKATGASLLHGFRM